MLALSGEKLMSSAREKAAQIREAMKSNNSEAQGIDKPVIPKQEENFLQQNLESGQEGKPLGENLEPEPDYKALYGQAVIDKEQSDKNYSELRKHADRIASENSRITRDLKVLSTGDTAVTTKAVPQEEPNSVAEITEQRVNESDDEYMGRLQLAVDEYPEVAGPIVDAMNAKYQSLSNRMDGFESQLNDKVMPVVDATKDKVANDVRDREKENERIYYDDISKSHPNYLEIVNSNSFATFLRNHGMGRMYAQMIFPDRDKGEQGGTAGEVISIFDEFIRSSAANQDDIAQQQASDNRMNAAQNDSVENIPNSPTSVEAVGNVESITRAQLDKWSKNPKLWNENKALIQAAQRAGRIIN